MKLKKDEIIVIRRSKEKNISHGGFEYPMKKGAIVEAKDWTDDAVCGGGLHGWTKGFTEYFDDELNGYFQVILVNKKDGYVELYGKVKFRKGKILYNGKDKNKAYKIIEDVYGELPLHWKNMEGGNLSTQKAGNYSTQKARDDANQKAGHSATQKAGYNSTQKAEHSSVQTAGNWSTQTAGNWSTQTAGDKSAQIAGGRSAQKAGDFSTSIVLSYQNSDAISQIVKTGKFSTVVYKNIQNKISKTFETGYNETTTFVIDSTGKLVAKYHYTPENIESLREHEIIVFGTNKQGNHAGGLAKTCKETFGAIEGQAEGMQGQCFGIITMEGIEEIKNGLRKLRDEAIEQKQKIFLLTKIGTGIAGYSIDEITKVVNEIDLPANVVLPKEF